MYVTRPLSLYKNSSSSMSLPPPEGPNSGVLVIKDEESEMICFGMCKDTETKNFPIHQNKATSISYSSGSGETSYYYALPIPVLNQPLSSNMFYVVKTHGKHGGKEYTSSKEEGKGTRCFFPVIKDVKSRPLDPHDIYQQFHVFECEPACCSATGFYAKFVASDGFPPRFLRRKGWKVSSKTRKNYELTEALGPDTTLRARLPDLNFPLSYKNSEPVVVGKWYCPFLFIKDSTLKYQSEKSPYYEMALEQRWKQIYTCENYHNEGNLVTVNVAVKTEVVLLAGKEEALGEEKDKVDGVIWFEGNETSVGLNFAVVERNGSKKVLETIWEVNQNNESKNRRLEED